MTENYIKALHEVVNNEFNAIALTDEDLRESVNAQLPEDEQISHRTFEYWKAGESAENKGHYDTFCTIIKKARSDQKRELINLLLHDEKAWQRYAWLLERKFPEWNLKKLQENTIKMPDPVQINLNLNKG